MSPFTYSGPFTVRIILFFSLPFPSYRNIPAGSLSKIQLFNKAGGYPHPVENIIQPGDIFLKEGGNIPVKVVVFRHIIPEALPHGGGAFIYPVAEGGFVGAGYHFKGKVGVAVSASSLNNTMTPKVPQSIWPPFSSIISSSASKAFLYSGCPVKDAVIQRHGLTCLTLPDNPITVNQVSRMAFLNQLAREKA